MDDKKGIKLNMLTIILIVALIAIIVMGWIMFKQNKKIKELNGEFSSTDIEESTETNIPIKDNYKELTEEIAKNFKNLSGTQEQKNSDQNFVVLEIIKNDNNTHTIKGRIYKDVKLSETVLTEEQYQDLLNNKQISLFDSLYALGEYYDYYPGYGLVDSDGIGFAVSSNSPHELFNHNDMGFYKGTSDYYTITVDDTIEIESIDFGTKTTVGELDNRIENDTPYKNNCEIYKFIFENGKVSKIEN